AEIGDQLLRNERPLWIGAAMLGVLALMPGLPKIPFLALSGGRLLYLNRRRTAPATAATPQTPPPPEDEGDKKQLDDFLVRERASVEVGSRLIPFVKSGKSKGIAERITILRRDFARSNGLWVPPIRVVSSLDQPPESYRFLVAGREVASGEIRADRMLAIAPEGRPVDIPGEQTTEPAFGLPARWIHNSHQRQAEMAGCTVVDPVSVLITHLGELLKRHGHELITREDLHAMLDRVKEFAPAIVDELKPDVVKMGTLHQVVTRLAAERVPLADFALVLESVGNYGPAVKDPDELVERVRADLGPIICERYRDTSGGVRVVSLHPQLEGQFRERLRDKQLLLGAHPLEKLLEQLGRHTADAGRRQQSLALLTDPVLRRPLSRILSRAIPELGVISYAEIPSNLSLVPVAMIRLEEVFDSTELTAAAGTPAAAPKNEPNRIPGRAAA
ncbi:MAG: FHIPEP family type III secretion protein, partial [Planctomycetaceae bacterium]